MHLICDSYVGFDTKMEVTLVVDEATKAAEIEAEDDISEPDEGKFPLFKPGDSSINNITDSLAGQMNALKTGGLTGPPPKKKKKPVAEESSDEESNTDGEEAEDTSETDTDTDEE
jgi:translocation protein SEC63